jgi:hypothetical protein
MTDMEVPMRTHMSSRSLVALLVFGLSIVSAPEVHAQSSGSVLIPPPIARTIDLSGPRFGFTSLGPGVVEALKEREIVVSPLVSQFGWQFERGAYTRSGVAAMTEVVALVGGLDQSVVLPSLTWLVGVRTAQGAEFGIGPNITPAGAALVLAGGVTFRSGALNVPFNVAVVPSRAGVRVTVLTGFTMRH